MAPTAPAKKRKQSAEVTELSDDEIIDGLLDGALSQSEDDSDFVASGDEDEEDEDEDEDKDEDDEHDDKQDIGDLQDLSLNDLDDDAQSKELAKDGANGGSGDGPEADDEDRPNYRVVEDANSGIRYVYDEINPVYDSDDSDKEEDNRIGDIPLSFYEAYPHVGYTIDGKKLMRPSERRQALDSLLDSIEIPKGWTGLTDPTTGKPLNLSQDELELLKRVQMNEIPEEGYDPYPVGCRTPVLNRYIFFKCEEPS